MSHSATGEKKYYEHYIPKLDSLYKGTDVIDACSAVNLVLKKEWFYYNTNFEEKKVFFDHAHKKIIVKKFQKLRRRGFRV